MRLGLHPVDFGHVPPADLAGHLDVVAAATEQAGFADLLLMDHWLQLDFVGPVHDPVLAGYTTLGYLAARTSTVRLGLLVTGVTYRWPGLLAKIVATLDVLSGGRALLGIGAAWYEREHHALGVPFPPLGQRFEHLEDAVRICRQMWSDDDGPFTGHHHRLAETVCRPAPLQPGGPPVLIGGNGERRTLRLVAEHADACNLISADPDEVARKLAVLDRHCAAVGRDPATVERTLLWTPDALADPGRTRDVLQQMAALGVTSVHLVARGTDAATFAGRAGRELLPALS